MVYIKKIPYYLQLTILQWDILQGTTAALPVVKLASLLPPVTDTPVGAPFFKSTFKKECVDLLKRNERILHLTLLQTSAASKP